MLRGPMHAMMAIDYDWPCIHPDEYEFSCREVEDWQIEMGPTTDIRGCGVLLYGLLCGTWPWHRESVMETARAAIMGEEPSPLAKHVQGLPAGLEDVVMRAIAHDPGDRFQDARGFVDALKPFSCG